MLNITFHCVRTCWPDYALSNRSGGLCPTLCVINQCLIPMIYWSNVLIGLFNLAAKGQDIRETVEFEQVLIRSLYQHWLGESRRMISIRFKVMFRSIFKINTLIYSHFIFSWHYLSKLTQKEPELQSSGIKAVMVRKGTLCPFSFNKNPHKGNFYVRKI